MSQRRTGSRSLGQNFLVDQNIIDVIARLAALSPDDVVLEVGGGEGILTRRLAAETRWVHLIEIDRGLADGLVDSLGPHGDLHLGDAVHMPLDFDPAPTKMVANLPYSVAATVVIRTLFETAITEWVVMVQREVGERFAAKPGSKLYGVPSVLAQSGADVKVLRPVSRQVFRPVPNVDSVLLGLRRRADLGFSPAVRKLVADGFAHRRKPLARSVSITRGVDMREQIHVALLSLGLSENVRAEALTPAEFVALSARLAL